MNDLRYALRTLARSPGFTLTAVLTLALGIGAATAGFSLLNWVLLRPLPGVRDPARLGLVWFALRTPDGGYQPYGLTLEQRHRVLLASPAVGALAGRQTSQLNVAAGTQSPHRVAAEFVSTDYFATLGAPLPRGRGFVPDDEAPPSGRPVVVISDALWHQAFGGRPDVLGQRVMVNGISFSVIGVAAPGFHGTERFGQPDLWLPGPTEWDVRHLPVGQRPAARPYMEFVLRLRPGATFDQATSQLKSAMTTVAAADTSRLPPGTTANVFPGVGLSAMGRDAISHQLALVMGVAGLMLVVTCANVANLLLFRHAQRRDDLVVRLALGASRGRLVGYFLTESAMVGLLSAVAGVTLALWFQGLFRHLKLLRFLPVEELSLDWRVVAFAAAVGLCAALAAGLIPALFGSRADLGMDLRAGGPRQAGRAPLLRTGLATLQVAISLTLVTGAYLLARTLQSYARVPLGFDPTGVTVFDVDPETQGYTEQRAHVYLSSLAERVAATPGVERIAFVDIPPFTGISFTERVRRSDAPPDAALVSVVSEWVSADYFATLRIPLVRGATFQAGDAWPVPRQAVGKVILSESLARRLFGVRDPVGGSVELVASRGNLAAQVVGVVGDVHWIDRGGDVVPILYQPPGQGYAPYAPMLAVRARGPRASLTRAVEAAGRALDPSIPINSRGPLSESVAASLSAQTTLFRLVGVLSTLTLLLAAVGVYGLVAYGVATRTREFGVRLALGAATPDIVRAAARPALAIVAFGVLGGVAGAMYATRFIAVWLYGVSPLDPVAFTLAAALLAGAVALATWLPARRATRVDPMVALRHE